MIKTRKQSRTLWFNGVMGFISAALLGIEFFADVVKEIAPAWIYMSLLSLCAINNAANWWLRLHTSRPIE